MSNNEMLELHGIGQLVELYGFQENMPPKMPLFKLSQRLIGPRIIIGAGGIAASGN